MVYTTHAGVSDQWVFASFNINGLFVQVGGIIRLSAPCVCLGCVLVALHEDHEGSELLYLDFFS